MLQLNFFLFGFMYNNTCGWEGDGEGGREGGVDCEQSPFFFQFREGNARARKQRAARNEKKQGDCLHSQSSRLV